MVVDPEQRTARGGLDGAGDRRRRRQRPAAAQGEPAHTRPPLSASRSGRARRGPRPRRGQRFGAAGALRVGQQHAAFAVDHGGQRLRRQATGDRASASSGQATPPARPALSRRGAGGGGQVGGVGGRIAEQQGDQLATTPAAHVLDPACACAKPSTESAASSSMSAKTASASRESGSAPSRPGGRRRRSGARRPGRRSGRRPGASRGSGPPLLAAAEGQVDLAAGVAPGVGIADQRDELGQRLPHAAPDPAAEPALERPRVLGHLRAIDSRISALIGSISLRSVGDGTGKPRQGSTSSERRFLASELQILCIEVDSDANTYLPGRRNLIPRVKYQNEKVANLGGVIVPFVATIVAIILFPSSLVSPGILAIAAFM